MFLVAFPGFPVVFPFVFPLGAGWGGFLFGFPLVSPSAGTSIREKEAEVAGPHGTGGLELQGAVHPPRLLAELSPENPPPGRARVGRAGSLPGCCERPGDQGVSSQNMFFTLGLRCVCVCVSVF